MSAYAEGLCRLGFNGYVGKSYYDSDYDFAAVIPSSQGWASGDRRVICMAMDFDGAKLTQSVHNSHQ